MANQPGVTPSEIALVSDRQRERRIWRQWAWLGVASLFAPVYVIIEPPARFVQAQFIQAGYHVVLIWTLVIFSSNSVPVNTGSTWSFILTAFFSSSPFLNVGILLLAELVLLLAGCILLFRQTGGAVCFIVAATIESALYAYVVLSAFLSSPPQPITVYFLPVGPVFAGIVGVGSLILIRREEQALQDQQSESDNGPPLHGT